MKKECECYEEEVQPYRKMDYKPIIYILSQILELPWSFGINNSHGFAILVGLNHDHAGI